MIFYKNIFNNFLIIYYKYYLINLCVWVDIMDLDNVKFMGILKDKSQNKENTYNGVISFKLNSLYVEESSRLTGKLKNSYEIPFDDISVDNIERKAFNKLTIATKDHLLNLRVTDEEMLDEFEQILKYKLTGELEKGELFVSNTTDEIKKYYELFKEGIITEEEFEAKKKQLLDL